MRLPVLLLLTPASHWRGDPIGSWKNLFGFGLGSICAKDETLVDLTSAVSPDDDKGGSIL